MTENLFYGFTESNEFNGKISFDENIAPRTTFKVGGTAKVFAEPEDINSFCRLLKFIFENKIKYFILGGGSNIVFADGVFEGIVISTGKLNEISAQTAQTAQSAQSDQPLQENTLVTCGAGVTVTAFVNFCSENNLWNAQEFAGLPGSAGGAVFMNARCFNKSISDIFVSAKYVDTKDFSVKEKQFNSAEWDYKKSPFQDGKKIILEATFRLQKNTGKEEELKAECKKYVSERVEKGHFKYPSAGSVFKNNHTFGKPSGAIIDEAGLKGLEYGGAQVAPWHGNFIINKGNATADDICTLVKQVQEKVREKTGFLLEPEIIFCGNN